MRGNWFALVLCAVVVSAAVVAAVGTAGPKDAKAPAKAKAADATDAAANAAAAADAKAAPKERKGLKDWQKMNDAAYRELEDAWMDDEEDDPDELMPTKWRKGADGKRQPPMPRGPKMEMGFATLTPGTTKEQCEEIAIRWSQLLSTGAVQVKAYAIEDDKILLGVDGGYPDMFAVKDFVLNQKETTEFEWQQQKFKPTHSAGGKQTKEDKAAAAKREKEAELRRKIESGELFDEKNKAKAKAKAKGDAKAKAKVKAKDAPKPKGGKADAKKADAKPKAEKKKDSAAKPKAAKAKAKDEL